MSARLDRLVAKFALVSAASERRDWSCSCVIPFPGRGTGGEFSLSRSTASAGLSLELALKISTSPLISSVSGMGILSIP